MLVNRKRYNRNDLIKAVIQFKVDNQGRLPDREDWKKGKIKPSLRTFQRRFKSIGQMLEEADKYNSISEFEIKLSEIEKKKEIKEYKRKYRKKKKEEIEEQWDKEKITRPRRRKSSAKQPYGFQCPLCGNWTTNPYKYYSSLTIILTMRFIELLNSSNGNAEGYFEGVLDSFYKVFGPRNPVVRHELEKAGYLEKFDQRFRLEQK